MCHLYCDFINFVLYENEGNLEEERKEEKILHYSRRPHTKCSVACEFHFGTIEM